jgi:hypothetical protein
MGILKIINYIRKHKLKKSEICKKCGITPSMLDDIIYFGKSVDFKVAQKLADEMGMGVYELYIYDYQLNYLLL